MSGVCRRRDFTNPSKHARFMITNSTGARVLVVDDNRANRYALVRCLQGAGHQLLEAATGQEALSIAREHSPDIILLDIRLPDVSGLQVCEELKRQNHTAHIPVIHVSAHLTKPDDRIQGLQSGADALLVTPFHPSELLLQVSALLRISRAEAAHKREAAKKQRAEADLESAMAALRTSRDRYELLSRVISSLLIAPDPQTVIQSLCEEVRTYLQCAVFFNYLLDPAARRLRLNACGGVDVRMARLVEGLELGNSLCGAAARDRCRVLAEDLPMSSDPRSALERSLGITAYACHPLLGPGDEVLGTLSFGASNRERFDAEDLGLMKTVTDHVAAAMLRRRSETALRQNEQRLSESQDRFKTMADGLPLIVWVHDASGQQQFVNQTFCEFFGVTLEDMKGGRWQMFLHPENAAAYIQSFANCVRDRTPFHAEVRVRRADGDWRWLESWARPRFSDAGEYMGFVGASADITARKQAEAALGEAQEQLRVHAEMLEETVKERTAKLEETIADLEQFSYSLSHDMRAPLRSMNSFSEFLLEEYGRHLDSTGSDYLRRIKSAASRMDELIRDVLTYSHVAKDNVKLTPVNLDRLATDIIQGYPQFAPDRASIEVTHPLLAVTATVPLLTLCLSNLLGNAVKFVAKGTTPAVKVWTEQCGSLVRFCVRDNGVGITPNAHEKLWQLFERGHHQSEYPGTGIGLSIVKRAIERMGGHVGVESKLGEGSTFWFELPKAEDV
jgi:PAS domain S-box-containing protein